MTSGVEITVGAGSGEYPVHLGAGALDRLPSLVRLHAPSPRYAVISDATVAGLHGARVVAALESTGARVDLLTFPPGEARKNRESWSDLTDRMLAAGFDRDSVVVALGGGVTGDLAGFVAATYMRGVPVVQVPTSLVAMIDASVGGKTGVDVPGGKNLVGAFHPPRLVLADPEVISTLPRPERARGLAEALKHGAILDREYLETVARLAPALLDADPSALHEVVARSVALKSDVVTRDEREGGIRRILNFGHTLAHALEAVTDFALPHGEAVAIGMVLEARIGEGMGITEPGTAAFLEERIRRLELPTEPPPGLDPAAVLAATRSDKKKAGTSVRYSLILRPGGADPAEGAWARAVPDEPVLEVLTS